MKKLLILLVAITFAPPLFGRVMIPDEWKQYSGRSVSHKACQCSSGDTKCYGAPDSSGNCPAGCQATTIYTKATQHGGDDLINANANLCPYASEIK